MFCIRNAAIHAALHWHIRTLAHQHIIPYFYNMQAINEQQYLPRFARMNRPAGQDPLYVLAGDLGGTNTRLALFEAVGGTMQVVEDHVYRSRDYASFAAIIQEFVGRQPSKPPQRICIGVAGPVIKGKVELTNLSRELTVAEIQQAVNVEETTLINDLEATAYGLATLTTDSLVTLHSGQPGAGGNMAIIAPGTGLGEAGLYWDGTAYAPFATEGGHCDFAPVMSWIWSCWSFCRRNIIL